MESPKPLEDTIKKFDELLENAGKKKYRTCYGDVPIGQYVP
jgi:hypothetical protein